jgi:hypothetical protein
MARSGHKHSLDQDTKVIACIEDLVVIEKILTHL